MYTHKAKHTQSTHLSSHLVESKRRVDGSIWIDDVKDDGWMRSVVTLCATTTRGARGRQRERERRCAVRRGVGAMPARAGIAPTPRRTAHRLSLSLCLPRAPLVVVAHRVTTDRIHPSSFTSSIQMDPSTRRFDSTRCDERCVLCVCFALCVYIVYGKYDHHDDVIM